MTLEIYTGGLSVDSDVVTVIVSGSGVEAYMIPSKVTDLASPRGLQTCLARGQGIAGRHTDVSLVRAQVVDSCIMPCVFGFSDTVSHVSRTSSLSISHCKESVIETTTSDDHDFEGF